MPKYVEEYYESSECDSFDDSEGDEPPSKRKRRGPNTGQSPIRRWLRRRGRKAGLYTWRLETWKTSLQSRWGSSRERKASGLLLTSSGSSTARRGKYALMNPHVPVHISKKIGQCKHLAGMMVRLKKIAVPDTAKSVPLSQKRRRGRPPKSKPALIVQWICNRVILNFDVLIFIVILCFEHSAIITYFSVEILDLLKI